MKRSRAAAVAILLFAVSTMLTPRFALANDNSDSSQSAMCHTCDSTERVINKPNLSKSDGFDETTHQRTMKRQAARKRASEAHKPTQERNL